MHARATSIQKRIGRWRFIADPWAARSGTCAKYASLAPALYSNKLGVAPCAYTTIVRTVRATDASSRDFTAQLGTPTLKPLLGRVIGFVASSLETTVAHLSHLRKNKETACSPGRSPIHMESW
jgi:hypothetical protein